MMLYLVVTDNSMMVVNYQYGYANVLDNYCKGNTTHSQDEEMKTINMKKNEAYAIAGKYFNYSGPLLVCTSLIGMGNSVVNIIMNIISIVR